MSLRGVGEGTGKDTLSTHMPKMRSEGISGEGKVWYRDGLFCELPIQLFLGLITRSKSLHASIS